jgi:tetratricopeptide (TPR) repeat protein
MDGSELRKAHRYADSIKEYRQHLEHNPGDWAAVSGLAASLMAAGAYAEAVPLLHRLDEDRCESLPGSSGRKFELACCYWCLDQWPAAMELMRGLVQGILDGTIEFGDSPGGAKQGLLLHYMGVTARDRDAVEFSLSYLRTLAERWTIKYWPGPLARYLLRQVGFEEVLLVCSGQSTVSKAIEAARSDGLKRRETCVALFHDGVRRRAEGEQKLCMGRMLECLELENPFIEPEWYLSRYEVERAAHGIHWCAAASVAPPRPTTGEEYARMPSGTHYVHPADGTVRRKR